MSRAVHMLRLHAQDEEQITPVECGYAITSKMKTTKLVSEVDCLNCNRTLLMKGRIKEGSDREYMNWYGYNQAVNYIVSQLEELELKPKYVYGIPRNGLPLAVSLSHRLDIPIILELRTGDGYELSEVLIVDDICDTGKTLNKYIGIPTVALYHKPSTANHEPTIHVYQTDKFVQFPWETDTSAKVDYLEAEK